MGRLRALIPHLRRGRRLRRLFGRRARLAVLASAFAFLAGLSWFAERAARPEVDDGGRTDAIVVLTGGSERLSTGLALLADERASALFVSGVSGEVSLEALLRQSGQTSGGLPCCIVLGHAAADTRGNALETADWMRRQGYSSLRLVTANYHMARSLLEFRRVMPEAVIIPHPVHPASVHLEDWWRWPGSARLLTTEYLKYLLALGRSLVIGPVSQPV